MQYLGENNFIVHTVLPEHVTQWAALEKACFSTPWSAEQCYSVLEQKHFTALGLWENASCEGIRQSEQKDDAQSSVNVEKKPAISSTDKVDMGTLLTTYSSFASWERPEQSASLLAYIAFYHMFDEMEILNIAVAPFMRRQGLGSIVLAHALQSVKEKGLDKAFLEVRQGNAAARQLYEKFSFICVGKRKKYYSDTGEDACIYTLAF